MKLPMVLNPIYRVIAQNIPERLKPTTRGIYNNINKILTYGYHKRDIFTAIDLEINSHCNLECQYCPASFKNGRRVKYMPEQLFKKVIDDLSEINYSGRVSPHFFGEPLLDNRLPELMSYARYKLPISQIIIHTNGIRLTQSLYDECIDAGVTGFLITQHTKKTPRNVNNIMSSKHARNGTIKVRSLDNITLFNRAGSVSPDKERKMKKCFYISDEIAITHSGNVVCTNDFHETHIFGNVIENNLWDIWNSSDFVSIRKSLKHGVFKLDMCKRCSGC